MPTHSLQDRIRTLLEKEFSPSVLEVHDDSGRHQGHAGARPGGGSHFRILLVSEAFRSMKPLQRHRAVYRVLAGLMQDNIHALQMELLTAEERRAGPQP